MTDDEIRSKFRESMQAMQELRAAIPGNWCVVIAILVAACIIAKAILQIK